LGSETLQADVNHVGTYYSAENGSSINLDMFIMSKIQNLPS